VARRWIRRLAPVALVAVGACATRGDVRLVREDLGAMRAETARADSARRAQLDVALRQLRALEDVQDSLRTLAVRLTRFQGQMGERLHAIDQQLIQVQELTGQSQRRLQELRASLEERQTAAVPDTSAGGGGGGNPGPNQLFQLALAQLQRGSAGAARSAFEDLLRQNPPADLAADAQFYVGESHVAEGDTAQAVSAYETVVARYPRSARAPTALYKHALVLQAQGRRADARTMYTRVVTQYPRSDEAVLARDRLRTLRQ
jgi:tol-pal system protein YbgF